MECRAFYGPNVRAEDYPTFSTRLAMQPKSDLDSCRVTFKFIMVGDTAVGKSCIISRFRDRRYTTTHDATIGVNFTNQTMHIGTTEVKLQLWDTAGQEIYRLITRSYYRDSHCAIVVCDLTKPDTFRSLSNWIEDVRTLAPQHCKVVIVGNKIDLERQVTTEELSNFARTVDCPVFETSAKTGENVHAMFEECAMLVYTDVSRLESRQWSGPPKTVASAATAPRSTCC
jgi:Ras-related protein Rab-2A